MYRICLDTQWVFPKNAGTFAYLHSCSSGSASETESEWQQMIKSFEYFIIAYKYRHTRTHDQADISS